MGEISLGDLDIYLQALIVISVIESAQRFLVELLRMTPKVYKAITGTCAHLYRAARSFSVKAEMKKATRPGLQVSEEYRVEETCGSWKVYFGEQLVRCCHSSNAAERAIAEMKENKADYDSQIAMDEFLGTDYEDKT